MATRAAEVIVVGLGAMGSAVAHRLAARGRTVLGFDRFAPPHDRGSTHGDTRITRLAIGEGAEYVPLVRRAHELWPEIEHATGMQLVQRTGGLVLGPPGSPFLAGTRAAARAYDIDHDDLTARQLRQRFPMFRVEDDTEGYLEPTAGVLRPERAVAAQLALAERSGARLRRDEAVTGWRASAGGVTVSTGRGTYAADQLVLCPGPWLASLLPELAGLAAVQRQCLYWFEVREGYEQLRAMPIFIWDFGGERPEFAHGIGFYGFPALDGPAGGVKVGTETHLAVDGPDLAAPVEAREVAQMYEEYVSERMPWLGPRALRTATCFYTSTRESRFLIDRHPSHENVAVVSACSGHGFKHSPAVGEAVAELVLDGRARIDLEPFRLARHVQGATVDR